MIAKIKSCGLVGIDGFIVDVEVDISNGIPNFDIVGLPDMAVKESKERVRAAIKNSGFQFPIKRITINLAPGDIKKEGSIYDLPIAIAVLFASGQIKIDNIDKYMFIGELSLNGELRAINGVLPIAAKAYESGINNIILPFKNAHEASVVKGLNIYPVSHLSQIISHFKNETKLKKFEMDSEKLSISNNKYDLDFSDVKGQENVKRALEVAAAGGHNIIMIGSPGSGKTMLAKRLPTILPDMTFKECLEVTKIHSVAGWMPSDTPLITTRPFRNPHHTITRSSLVGGGKIPKPGEISLAHFGVLFLDELPEFKKDVLEVMRQPLEDGKITISRVSATITYPSECMLVASMNPCKCGYYGHPTKPCTCTPLDIQKYLGRISAPLLDRIDLHVEVPPVEYKDLDSKEKTESSKEIKKRVNMARSIQLSRYKDLNIFCNSQLKPSYINKFCKLGNDERNLLRTAFDKLGLSARAYSKILKVSRTIADLDESENIKTSHIAEAIQYRSLDRKFWN